MPRLIARLRKHQLSPKRLVSTQALDAWFPYYAGFAGSFVENVLNLVKPSPGSVVLDPWNGSGTTTSSAFEAGYYALGCDINPAANAIAQGKIAALILEGKKLEKAVFDLSGAWSDMDLQAIDDSEPLLLWLDKESARLARSVIEQAKFICSNKHNISFKEESHLSSFLFFCILRSCRELVLQRCWSNPTWVKVEKPVKISSAQWHDKFLEIARGFISEAQSRNISSGGECEIFLGDSRRLNLQPSSVDVVITSPPYCTRIDYAVTTGFELAMLGVKGNQSLRSLRESIMGTPVQRQRGIPEIPSEWARAVKHLLVLVRDHDSYASRSYYYKNFWQYFHDAHESLKEMARVMKKGALGFIVVQNSYYKEIELDLPFLYAEIALNVGFDLAREATHVPAKDFFVSINKHSKQYLPNRDYKESVVLIRR